MLMLHRGHQMRVVQHGECSDLEANGAELVALVHKFDGCGTANDHAAQPSDVKHHVQP